MVPYFHKPWLKFCYSYGFLILMVKCVFVKNSTKQDVNKAYKILGCSGRSGTTEYLIMWRVPCTFWYSGSTMSISIGACQKLAVGRHTLLGAVPLKLCGCSCLSCFLFVCCCFLSRFSVLFF